MKNFDFLLCFSLCVLPYLFTVSCNSEHEIKMMSSSMGITVRDMQECLSKSETDWDTIKELSKTIYIEDDISQYPQEMVRDVSCFAACICIKTGLLVNSKIIPEKVIEAVSTMPRNRGFMPEPVRRILLECINKVSSETDDCKTIFTFNRCSVRGIHRH